VRNILSNAFWSWSALPLRRQSSSGRSTLYQVCRRSNSARLVPKYASALVDGKVRKISRKDNSSKQAELLLALQIFHASHWAQGNAELYHPMLHSQMPAEPW